MPRKTRLRANDGNVPADGFNEAAARCRGKHAGSSTAPPASAGFNEAAARCRGKRGPPVAGQIHLQASMRPRPDAAENVARAAEDVAARLASMRPRPDAAENAPEADK